MPLEHGKVTSVNYEDGVVTCNVRAIRQNEEYSNVAVMRDFSGRISLPKERQTVLMNQLSDGTRIILGILAREENTPDSMRDGETTLKVDKDTEIAIEKNGDNHDVRISASGDVYIEGRRFTEHTHDYEDSTGDGASTKTTDPPN
jgi:hypothetical protein